MRLIILAFPLVISFGREQMKDLIARGADVGRMPMHLPDMHEDVYNVLRRSDEDMDVIEELRNERIDLGATVHNVVDEEVERPILRGSHVRESNGLKKVRGPAQVAEDPKGRVSKSSKDLMREVMESMSGSRWMIPQGEENVPHEARSRIRSIHDLQMEIPSALARSNNNHRQLASSRPVHVPEHMSDAVSRLNDIIDAARRKRDRTGVEFLRKRHSP